MNEFNECKECSICCKGWLIGNAYDMSFGDCECGFLEENKCTIYNIRPIACKRYFCAWKQKLFPIWMRPDLCQTLISVEINKLSNRQYLKVISKDQPSPEVINELEKFSKTNECEILYVRI